MTTATLPTTFEMTLRRGESHRDSATCTLAGAKELLATETIHGYFWCLDSTAFIDEDGLVDEAAYYAARKLLD